MTLDAKTRRLLALLLTVPLAFSVLFFIANQIGEHIDIRFLQLENLASSVNRILSLCKDAETGERGFLLTGDSSSLAPLEQANAWFPGESNLCRAYAKDRPALQRKVEHAITLAKKRIQEANQAVEMQRTKGSEAALGVIRSGDAQGTMDLVRSSVSDIQGDISRAQTSYLDHERTLNHWAFILFITGTAVMILVLAALYHALLHFIQARDTAQEQLRALNAELEASHRRKNP